jgi:pimeloyl-ACP methyl ester carboxylesterase
VHVPVLVVTGEAALDRVVPPRLTAEYTRVWPHATAVTLERTGHLGLVTRPEAFADMIAGFAAEAGLAEAERRRTGGYVRGTPERRVG